MSNIPQIKYKRTNLPIWIYLLLIISPLLVLLVDCICADITVCNILMDICVGIFTSGTVSFILDIVSTANQRKTNQNVLAYMMQNSEKQCKYFAQAVVAIAKDLEIDTQDKTLKTLLADISRCFSELDESVKNECGERITNVLSAFEKTLVQDVALLKTLTGTENVIEKAGQLSILKNTISLIQKSVVKSLLDDERDYSNVWAKIKYKLIDQLCEVFPNQKNLLTNVISADYNKLF